MCDRVPISGILGAIGGILAGSKIRCKTSQEFFCEIILILQTG